MRRKQRSLNQIKEDASVRILRDKLPEEWVIHSYGADYGIDCVVELFDYVNEEKIVAETLGENFFVQLKASGSIEYGTRKAYARGNVAKGPLNENKEDFVEIEVAKFQLEMSELLTVQAMGIAVPVLLVLVDTDTQKAFFICLNDYIEKVIAPEDPEYATKNSKVIYIPTANEIIDEEDALVPLRAYGKRSKMYGAFGMFSYQLKEVERARGLAAFPENMSQEAAVSMIKTFTQNALRQDIWKGHDFWQPMVWSYNELEVLNSKLSKGVGSEDFDQFLVYCQTYIWHRLNNLGNMYEELVREWFLPTYLAQLTSYPGEEGDAEET